MPRTPHPVAELLVDPTAFRWAAAVGLGRGTRPARAAGTYSCLGSTIEGLEVAAGAPGAVLRAVIAELTRRGLGPITYCAPERSGVAAAELERLGFVRLAEWITVRRELRTPHQLAAAPFALAPLLDRLADGLPILEETVGGLPGYEGAPGERVLADLIAGARRPSLDPLGWMVAYHDARACGLLLPEHGRVGMLAAFGIARWARGRGWGRSLHRYGLNLLAMHGAREYVDYTLAANRAMRGVFRSNGCREAETFCQWRRPASGLEGARDETY
jgi:hypothetical protein